MVGLEESDLPIASSNKKLYLYILPSIFSIISFWFFPTIWCSFFGCCIGYFTVLFFVNHNTKFSMISGFIAVIEEIFLFVIVSQVLTQDYWLWKYFSVVPVILLVTQGLSYVYYITPKKAIILSGLFFLLLAVTTLNNSNINLWLILGLILFFVIVFNGYKSQKKYSFQEDEKLNKVCGMSSKEIRVLLNQVPNLSSDYGTKSELKEIRSYFFKALKAFRNDSTSDTIDYLEKVFNKLNKISENEIKGYQNKDDFNNFCNLAEKMAKFIGCNLCLPKTNNWDKADWGEDLISFQSPSKKEKNKKKKDQKKLKKLLDELDSLTGLDSVKKEIQSIIGLVKLNEQRRKQGLEESSVSLHLVFSGNPGTGKTTVARLLASIYKELGVLSKGQCKETDYEGLVSQYVSETPIKTKEVIEEAMGGILFIDEAYTLSPEDNPRDHGQEAIDTLLKYMEDKRDDFMVIVAGYPNEMKRFITSNPGLESRFTTYIHFEDYNGKELYDIFMHMVSKEEWIIQDGLNEQLREFFLKTYENRPENFANAREIRNYLDLCKKRQALRLANNDIDKLSKKDLQTLSKEDLNLV